MSHSVTLAPVLEMTCRAHLHCFQLSSFLTAGGFSEKCSLWWRCIWNHWCLQLWLLVFGSTELLPLRFHFTRTIQPFDNIQSLTQYNCFFKQNIFFLLNSGWNMYFFEDSISSALILFYFINQQLNQTNNLVFFKQNIFRLWIPVQMWPWPIFDFLSHLCVVGIINVALIIL